MNAKVALISGGSGGIGQQIAKTFAKEGIAVILFARNEAKLKTVVSEIIEQDGQAEYITGDICNIEDIKNTISLIKEKYGSLHILVNSAGGGPVGGLQKTTDTEWLENIKVKQLGYIRLTREAIPLMIGTGEGIIINIIGVFGKQPSKDFIIGSVTNAALIAFTKAVADDTAQYNIRVNAINPGATNTELWSNTIIELGQEAGQDPESVNRKIAKLSPMGRIAEPSDIANVATFLISEKAGFITGISINVDGGTYGGI
ncbi:MAG: SDR family oxidoreductase [Anaerocolumna sp.]